MKNILVCLDLSDMDESLIRYANFAVKSFQPESITFINVMDTYDIPEELSDLLYSEEESVEDIIHQELKEKIYSLYTCTEKLKPEIILETGSTTERIVHYARKHAIDLCILGKKIGFEGNGGVARHIIGLIPSSVLMVTENTMHTIDKILVRTNFEIASFHALQMAEVVSKYTGAQIEMHHVYKLPYNYFPEQTPKALKKIRSKLDPHIAKKLNKFKKKYQISEEIPFSYSVNLHGSEAESLYKHAIKSESDLILTGTKLKSQLANIIMDSTSAKLASVDKNIPILIVKNKKESIGFLKALFD